MTEETIVRENLMTQEGYAPYCGSETCYYRLARLVWNPIKSQFYCKCGWHSEFPLEFIERYKNKWNINTTP